MIYWSFSWSVQRNCVKVKKMESIKCSVFVFSDVVLR